ncbi:MAG: hypothetical protein JWM33_2790 [Caulobacteraceae bacterium]|nr:hypothetical protein [Caulobacteraceae bacterium]
MRRFGCDRAAAIALAIVVCGPGLGAAHAASAPGSGFLDTPLANSVFTAAANGGIKHRATGLVCPATLGGVKLIGTHIGNSPSTEGDAGCFYGLNTADLQFAITLSPLKGDSKPDDIAKAYYFEPKLPTAPPLLPLGQPGGPAAGHFVVDGKKTTGVLVAAKDGWSFTLFTGYTAARAAQARPVATDLFKSFQDAKP